VEKKLNTPRILVVDDHVMVRKGIAELLKTRWDVCGEAGDGSEALDKFAQLKPDLVLLDLSMPVMDGTAVARAIRRCSPTTKIVVLSMHDDVAMRMAAKAKADEWVSKRASATELLKLIEGVLNSASTPTSLKNWVPY